MAVAAGAGGAPWLASAGRRALKPARDLINWFDQTFDARAENGKLREEVERARVLLVAGKAAEAENAELRLLVAFDRSGALPEGVRLVTGRVIVRPLAHLQSFVVIDRGAADCVKRGDVAFNGQGLVGRVESGARHRSRVVLVTDPSSAVSARVKGSAVRGIVEPEPGQPGSLKLGFINTTEPSLHKGQEILTSGWRTGAIASAFPANIPIGEISEASLSRQEASAGVVVGPFADFENLTFVQVMTRCAAG